MRLSELIRRIFPDTSHVSPNNHLVHSFIYGEDDREIVSKDNLLVRARFVEVKNPPAIRRPTFIGFLRIPH